MSIKYNIFRASVLEPEGIVHQNILEIGKYHIC